MPVLLCISLIAPAGELSAGEVEEQSARLKQLREHIGSLKDELGDMRGREAGLQRELESLDKAVARSAAEMRKLGQEKAALQARLAALEQEQRLQRLDMQEMRARLVQDLRSAYLTGQQEQVSNMGGAEASNIWLTCDLPPGLQVEEATATLGEVRKHIPTSSIVMTRASRGNSAV